MYLYQASYSQSKVEIKVLLSNGINVCDKAISINRNYSFAYFNQAKLICYGIEKGVFFKDREQEALELYTKTKSINPLLTK